MNRFIKSILCLLIVMVLLSCSVAGIKIDKIVQITNDNMSLAPEFCAPNTIAYTKHIGDNADEYFKYDLNSKVSIKSTQYSAGNRVNPDDYKSKIIFDAKEYSLGTVLLSNSGNMVVYELISERNSMDRSIWLMKLNDSKISKIIGSKEVKDFSSSAPSDQNFVVSFSYDDKYLLVYQGTGDVNSKIFIVDVNSGKLVLLPKPSGFNEFPYNSPSWSQNGYAVAFLVESNKYSGPDYYYGNIFVAYLK